MRIEINVPMDTGIDQVLQILSQRLNIPKKNIELVIIKN